MKKFILILIAFLSISFSNTAFSQQPCPNTPGWTLKSTIITINGCDYSVDFCVECFLTRPSIIRVMGFKAVNPNCVPIPFLNASQILFEITERASTDYQLITFLCTNIPPCDQGFPDYYYGVAENLCWQKETLPNGVIEYNACYWLTAYCYTQWKLCVNSLGGIDRVLYFAPEISGDEDDCTDPEPPNLPVGQVSSCFRISTRCD